MLKKLLPTIIFTFSVIYNGYAQIEASIIEAAHAYARAQINSDVESILQFTYPGLVEQAGGYEAMKNTWLKIHENQNKKGVRLQDFKVKEPIQHTSSNGEIHALVPVVTISKVPGGKLTSENYLIAVSESKNDHWYFIETTSIDEGNVVKVLGNWYGSLVLQFKKAPVFKENK